MTAPDLSPAEAEIVARFDAAPDLPESYHPSSPVALLDQLDELRAKATPGWNLVGGTHDRAVIDGRGLHVCETFLSSDAALIVAAVNAVGPLTAAVRAVLAQCERANALAEHRSGLVDAADVITAIRAALSVTP